MKLNIVKEISMRSGLFRALCAAFVITGVLAATSCAPSAKAGKKTIIVTYSILGSVVKDLVGDSLAVVVSIPDGLDPHEWEPSAKDIEAINNAGLVVENGLGLEEGMQKALGEAKKKGVKFFTASDHITVRTVGEGEGIPSGDPDQALGAHDPHLWTDPASMKAIVSALAGEIETDFKIDLSKRRDDLLGRLSALDAEVAAEVASLPAERRTLVTGHESMGYFAQHYGFKLVGAVVPSLSSQSESSAAELADLKKKIIVNHVSALFTELSENPNVAEALAKETGAKAVPLTTHSLPKDGDYFAFIRVLGKTITEALAK
jgi:zinc/manganese transport system substrate-binding protein